MARDGASQGGVALSCAFGGEMVRPSATGLATAFFRLYLLESLVSAPARPAALLAAIAAERLPFASGAFGRALQSLIEGGYLAPAAAATVCLTALGAAERTAERERWSTMLPTLLRLPLRRVRRSGDRPSRARHRSGRAARGARPVPTRRAHTHDDLHRPRLRKRPVAR